MRSRIRKIDKLLNYIKKDFNEIAALSRSTVTTTHLPTAHDNATTLDPGKNGTQVTDAPLSRWQKIKNMLSIFSLKRYISAKTDDQFVSAASSETSNLENPDEQKEDA